MEQTKGVVKDLTDADNHSETGKIRPIVLPFMKHYFGISEGGLIPINGLDLGFGGNRILRDAIAVDLPQKYGSAGGEEQNLYGDARILHWFKDAMMDYVYSSHLLEDFPSNETQLILNEWTRVLKVEGLLILYLPHEMRFKHCCDETGQIYNCAHSVPEMSLQYMLPLITGLGNLEILRTHEEIGELDYGFLIIAKKTY